MTKQLELWHGFDVSSFSNSKVNEVSANRNRPCCAVLDGLYEFDGRGRRLKSSQGRRANFTPNPLSRDLLRLKVVTLLLLP
jgi:hypothetical protein